jgi:HK97 gp10 family phage protein
MPLTGGDKHVARLRKLGGPEVVKAAGSVVYDGANMIQAEAFRSISAGSVGGRSHVPSAPGEPPNRNLGILQAGFETQQTGPLTAEFRAETPYSAALEFGTSKMQARPYVRPARDKMKPKIQALFREKMQAIIERSGT